MYTQTRDKCLQFIVFMLKSLYQSNILSDWELEHLSLIIFPNI